MATVVKMHSKISRYNFEEIENCFECVIYSDTFCNDKVYAIFLEKYFFRAGSATAANIIFEKKENGTDVTIVSAGGGEGLLNISWGAEDSFSNSIEKELQKIGFECCGRASDV